MITHPYWGKNQITLPAEIVKALALLPGMRSAWRIGPDGTLVASHAPSPAGPSALAPSSAPGEHLRLGSDPARDLIAERDRMTAPTRQRHDPSA